MFEDIREKMARREKLLFTVLSFLPVLVIFANSSTLRSFFIGIPAFVIYLLVNGEIVGRAFFEEEKPFFRLTFGLFMFIILMAFTQILSVSVLQIEGWYLLGMILAAIVSSLLNRFLVRYNRPERKTRKGKKPLLKEWYNRAIYVSYIVLFVSCFLILLYERSGWVIARPSIWAVIPPIFLQLYFIATFVLVVIVFLPGKVSLKLLLIALHSIFSLLFVPIMVYPGVVSRESWYDFGRARVVLETVSSTYATWSLGIMQFLRAMNSLLKGLSIQLFLVTSAEALSVDMYWSEVLLVPMLWGFFFPLTAYKLTKMIGGGKRASLFAALLTLANFYFLAWGKLTMSDSLGNLFFLIALYLLFRYLSSYKTRLLFPIFITLVVLVATHQLPAAMFISLMVLAFALKRYEYFQVRFSSRSRFVLLLAFIVSVFVLPQIIIVRGMLFPALGESSYSLDKLLRYSPWTIVLGVLEQTPVQEALLYYIIFPVLGLIGSVYTIQRKAKFNKTLCVFLFLAFGVCVVDHRILSLVLVGGLFSGARLHFFMGVTALPFLAIIIESAAKALSGTAMKVRSLLQWKNIAVGALVCIGLSSWVTLMVYDNYVYYTYGLIGTSLEVETIKFIDEHTDGRYVVFAPPHTTLIAWGLIGFPFPAEKTYVEAEKVPSVGDMYQEMASVDADVGYFIASSFASADFNKTIDTASNIFGLFQVLTDDVGDTYIFEYKIPPLPQSPDVAAFHWTTPPTYYVQNDLIRVIFNPETRNLAVQDFWGDLYENIGLDETIVGGNSLGNLTKVEYFSVTSNKWLEWTAQTEIAPSSRFEFRFRFENESLIGLVESGRNYVQLEWESDKASTLSLEIGNFKRLYIPGLIGGTDSYDINSQEYGFLYTRSLTDGVVFSPAYKPEVESSFLTYGQIVNYCNLTLTEGYMWYDLYVRNNATMDQWSYIEVWLPDGVYTGSFPPFYFSVDNGKTWVFAPMNVEVGRSVPVKTIRGAEVNWIFTLPRSAKEMPTGWRHYTQAYGVPPELSNFTDSGGAQNRMIFGCYLPAKDEVLMRIGVSVYYWRPLKTSYVFRDSDNPSYGLQNMEEGLIKYYNLGPSEYVGGLTLTGNATSLVITQDETGNIESIRISIPSNTGFSLLAAKEVDTDVDADEDGVPDQI